MHDNNNKIFVIGFNKTGTRTIHRFFDKHNIKSIHWDQGKIARTIKSNFDLMQNNNNCNVTLLGEYDKYNVLCDMEDIEQDIYANEVYFKYLALAYPNSKFILNIRNIENWIQSRLKHQNKILGNYADYLCKKYNLNILQLQEKWRRDFYTHINNVTTFFSTIPNRLVVFDIEKDNVDKLISFLPEYKLNRDFFIHYGKTTS
jgi:hypothetical protein